MKHVDRIPKRVTFEFNEASETDRPAPDGFLEITSNEQAQRLVDLVLGLGPEFAFAAKLKELSNYELAGLVIDFWAYLPADKPQSRLIDEVIERLKGDVVDDDCPTCKASGKGADGTENGCLRCHGNGVVVTGRKAGA